MSTAMMARLAAACLAAVLGGVWLFRSLGAPPAAIPLVPHDPQPRREHQSVSLLRILVLGWCALWAVIWLGITLLRVRYPMELEWCGGAMRDHCERVLAGLPLYAAPGPDWIPYEYPPLYFWVSALLMRALHDNSFMSLRLVSILSTLGCAVVLHLWVCRSTAGAAGRIWGAIAAGMFLATYRFTGAWYDVERLDMLFLLLALLGGYWLDLACGSTYRTYRSNTTYTTYKSDQTTGRPSPQHFQVTVIVYLLLSAVAFWLAFLTKQQAVLFLVGSAAALAWTRNWRDLAIFCALSAVLCFGSVALLNRATDGWFGYYCFRVPLANGIKLNLAAQFFLQDLPLYAPIIALIAVAVWLNVTGRHSFSTPDNDSPKTPKMTTEDSTSKPHPMAPEIQNQAPSPHHLITSSPPHPLTPSAIAWCLMGLVGSLLSRAHWGGDQNVLMAGFVAITLAGCMLAARIEASSMRAAAPLLALVMAQALVLVYRPDAQLPSAANRAAGDGYLAAVRNLERQGEVLCLDHGGVTGPRHFHLMALLDVIGTEKGLPPSLTQALRTHRFKAILTDAEPLPGGALDALTEFYEPAECLYIQEPWVATGFPTPGKGRQVWVLRPK